MEADPQNEIGYARVSLLLQQEETSRYVNFYFATAYGTSLSPRMRKGRDKTT
jgi:hypothetical protein